MTVTLLGTGTSTGVPMIGCDCATCLSTDPHDKRLRVSVRIESQGHTVLIDTSADFRQQMLSNSIRTLDAILYTHSHYDHIAGFDDLRAFQFLAKKSPMCYATQPTFEFIKQMFAYAFGAALQPGGGLPKLPFTIIDHQPFEVCGMTVVPIPLLHGKLHTLGFRIGDFAYLTDCSAIPRDSYALLTNLDTLVLDGLRFKEHPTHFSISQAINEAQKIAPRMTYFTHMNHDVMHEPTEAQLPANIRLGYDGLTFTFNDPQ